MYLMNQLAGVSSFSAGQCPHQWTFSLLLSAENGKESSSVTCNAKEITQPQLCVLCGCCCGQAQYFVDQSHSEIAEIFDRGVGLRREMLPFNPHSFQVCSHSGKAFHFLFVF